ncbi:toll/interleukin-1 receptor domain-containing protein [Streptomyces sp. NPDC003691]
MPLVFVNYRTGDEEGTATLIDRELSRRFGEENVFRASKSITPGAHFQQELLTAVRRSRVLLAVIGTRWHEVTSSTGRPALESPDDWTRKEIREAFETAAVVIPLLIGKVGRLRHEDLPDDIGELADCQYLRFNHRSAATDLERLVDHLVARVPELIPAEKRYGDERSASGTGTTAGQPERSGDGDADLDRRQTPRVDKSGQNGGIGDVHGGFSGTFVDKPQGPVHTGSGHLYQGRDQHFAPNFNGEGQNVNYIAGDNNGTARNSSGRGLPPEDGER